MEKIVKKEFGNYMLFASKVFVAGAILSVLFRKGDYLAIMITCIILAVISLIAGLIIIKE